MFDERLYIINKVMNRPIYPSYDELLIYENKRMTSYWLKLNGIPHPETHVFYRKKDFLEFLRQNDGYPIVVKSNIGSTAKGVRIVRSRLEARHIAHMLFGVANTKLAVGYTSQKTGRLLRFPALGTLEKHFVIVQKYEMIKWEWRIVKIGDSFFGHKKYQSIGGGYCSRRSLRKEWAIPPVDLFRLVKEICDKGDFYSMAIDILETTDGRHLVNEMHSLFGQRTEHLMYLDNIPGRFVLKEDEFIFEEGHFNRHCSYGLRVEHFVEILKERETSLSER